MKNRLMMTKLSRLQQSLLERAQEVGNLMNDITDLEEDRSNDVGSVIDGSCRDTAMVKDTLTRVRRTLFNR